MDPADASVPAVSKTRPSQLTAVGAVLTGGLAGTLYAFAALPLVRDQLHINCGMGAPGSEGAGTWYCADGIGYLGIAAVLVVMWFVATAAGSLIAGLVDRDRVARVLLVAVAAASVVWILGWTAYGSIRLVGDEHSPMSGVEYWWIALGAGATMSAVGIVLASAALFTRGLPTRILSFAGSIGLLASTLIQPGIGVCTLPAAGLLAAAALRAR